MINMLVIVVIYERIIHSFENSILRFFSCLIVSLEAAEWVITHDKVHLSSVPISSRASILTQLPY